ncbi:hypothetical protein IWW52_005004, partial [Coemansia sp. RSA 2704]
MAPGNPMHKLSQHVKGCFTMKRRRRSDTSTSDAGEQRSSSEMTIVHVSMEESRRNPHTLKETRGSAVPMNYWMNSDDDDDVSEASSVYSNNVLSREPSYVDILSDNETEFMPLRSAPKPRDNGKAPKAASESRARSVRRRFSRDEWQEKAGEALFGSCRNHQDEDSADSDDAWDGQSTPVIHSSEPEPRAQPPSPPKAVKQISGISLRVGQSPYTLCAGALNELLFSTNAQIDGDLHDMLEDYINGRGISNLTDDFETIVEHAYAGFITAAQSILDVAEETRGQEPVDDDAVAPNAPPPIRRYPSNKYEGSMESLLAEIVDCYTSQTEEPRSSQS